MVNLTIRLEVELDAQLNSPRVAVEAIADASECLVEGRSPCKAGRLSPNAGRRSNRKLERGCVRQIVDISSELKVAPFAELELLT